MKEKIVNILEQAKEQEQKIKAKVQEIPKQLQSRLEKIKAIVEKKMAAIKPQ